MEAYHRAVLKLAAWATGEEVDGLFTFHRFMLTVVMGMDWWDRPGLARSLRRAYSMAVIIQLISTAWFTYCSKLDTTTEIGQILFFNNIVSIFTVLYGSMKSMYFKFLFGKQTKELMDFLLALGDLGTGRRHWEHSIRMTTSYTLLLFTTSFMWTVYFFLLYGTIMIHVEWPWDKTTLHGWTAELFMAACAAYYISLIHATADTLLAVSGGILIGHMSRLKDHLHAIGRATLAADQSNIDDAVKLHVNLLSGAEKLNSCLSLLYTSQVIYTVMHACVILFSFAKSEDTHASAVLMFPMLTAAYTQYFMYCYYGQKITTEFGKLSFDCYDNIWYQSSLPVQKGLVNFARSAQKTVALKTMFNSKASLEAYIDVLQQSVSYYLVLKSVSSPQID